MLLISTMAALEAATQPARRHPEVLRAHATRLASLAPQHDAREASKGGAPIESYAHLGGPHSRTMTMGSVG